MNKLFRFNENGTVRELYASSWIKAFKIVMANFPHLGPVSISVVNLIEIKS